MSDPSSNPSVIVMATVSAPTNIACIKYWGKANKEWNTPINSSVSVTLDQADLKAVTTVAASPSFTQDRLWLNGTEEADAATSKRFRACIDGVKALATEKETKNVATGETVLVTEEDWKEWKIHVSSYNTFPTAAGLASSAAGYAALVASLAELMNAKEVFEGQLSTIARQGSGSACRSLYGGFVAWRKGGTQVSSESPNDWSDSVAQQVADEAYWPQIRALILVVSDAKKDTSSTSGMSTSVSTSKLLEHRAAFLVEPRLAQIEEAFLKRDFDTFGKLTMTDSNQFHATCLDTYPPIFYMNDISKSVIKLVHAYNDWAGGQIRAAYTFDAGPNAVLYTLEEFAVEVGALMLHYYPETGDAYISNPEFASQIKAFQLEKSLLDATSKTGVVIKPGDVKMMYYTKSGPGPQVMTNPIDANLDLKNGMNCFSP